MAARGLCWAEISRGGGQTEPIRSRGRYPRQGSTEPRNREEKAGPEGDRGRPRGNPEPRLERSKDVEDLAQEDGGQGALLGRNQQG